MYVPSRSPVTLRRAAGTASRVSGSWMYTYARDSVIVISEVVFVLGRLTLSRPLGPARRFKGPSVRVLVGISHRLQRAFETQRPQRGDIRTDGNTWLAVFQSVQ